jgi:hypothetical protein
MLISKIMGKEVLDKSANKIDKSNEEVYNRFQNYDTKNY